MTTYLFACQFVADVRLVDHEFFRLFHRTSVEIGMLGTKRASLLPHLQKGKKTYIYIYTDVFSAAVLLPCGLQPAPLAYPIVFLQSKVVLLGYAFHFVLARKAFALTGVNRSLVGGKVNSCVRDRLTSVAVDREPLRHSQ